MHDEAPLWLDLLAATIVGGLAGAAIAHVTGRDVPSRAAASATMFGLMTLTWRVGHHVEDKVRRNGGLPPRSN